MATIIETTNDKFEMICDSFHSAKADNFDAYIQMTVQKVKDYDECDVLLIEVVNELDFKNGDYLPFVFEKNELKKFIEFLQNQYNQL